MTPSRWNPFREIEDLMDRYNKLFANTRIQPSEELGGNRELLTTKADWMPAVDISETDKDYRIKVEIPEVKKEDVKVALQEGILTISGERRYEQDVGDVKQHRLERYYGSFVRSFSLPEDAQEENIDAEYRDGMLFLTVPKAEASKPKAIEVKVH